MVVLFLRHEYTIKRNTVARGCGARYALDADSIRTQNGCVQQKKMTVQYNSNHA